MIKILGVFNNKKIQQDKSKVSFTSKRDDKNDVAILKSNSLALNVPVQRRIKEALTRLAKDGSPDNVEFLLNVAQNLKYGVKSDSKLNKSIPNSFNYNYLNINSDSWDVLLKSSIAEALSYASEETKPHLQSKFDKLYPDKTKMANIEIENSDDEELKLLELREKLISSKLLNNNAIKKESHPQNKFYLTALTNLDKFIVSPEASSKEKIDCLNELNKFVSPEFKVDSQLKDKKIQILSEILNDISGHSKAMSQKYHGSCAAVSIARKFLASEYKLEFVKTIMSEVDNKPYMEVYNIYNFKDAETDVVEDDSKKSKKTVKKDKFEVERPVKVRVEKTHIDYKEALSRTYRVIDASVLNWMQIADTVSDGTKAIGQFSSFDSQNYNMFHDGHYLPNLPEPYKYQQLYLRGLNKIQGAISSIEKIQKVKTHNNDLLLKIEKSNISVNGFTQQKVSNILSNLGVLDSEVNSLAKEILNPKLVKNPSLKINDNFSNPEYYNNEWSLEVQPEIDYKGDERNLKLKKIQGLILTRYPELKGDSKLNESTEEILRLYELKSSSNKEYFHVLKKVKLSSSDSDMQNEFNNADYKEHLYEMEAFNRVTRDFELDILDRVLFYKNKFNLPKIIDSLEFHADKRSIEHSKMKDIDPEEKQFYLSQFDNIKNAVKKEILPQIDSIGDILGVVDSDTNKTIFVDYIDFLKQDVVKIKVSADKYMNMLDVDSVTEVVKKLDSMKAQIQTAKSVEEQFAISRAIGIEAKHDLFLNYLDHTKVHMNKNPDLAQGLSKYFSEKLGTDVPVPEAKMLVNDLISVLEEIVKRMDSYADFLQIPEDRELIMAEFEKQGEVMPKKILDKIYEKNKQLYIQKEQKASLAYEIMMNNKYLHEQFMSAGIKVGNSLHNLAPNSFANEQLSEIGKMLNCAASTLLGTDFMSLPGQFKKISARIDKIKAAGYVKDEKTLSALDSLNKEIKGYIPASEAAATEDFSDFYKQARKNYPRIRRFVIRERDKYTKQLQAPMQELYNQKGDYSDRFFVGDEGHSGLFTAQEQRIISQLTGVSYIVENNAKRGAQKLEKGRNGGVIAVSVSHDNPGLHAMHAYDVDKVKTVDNGGNVKVDKVVYQDNSWGGREVNGLRMDANGNLRTDYTRGYGEPGGFYVKEGSFIGSTLNELDTGVYKALSSEDDSINYKSRVFSDFILPGVDKSAQAKVSDLIFDLIDLSHSSDPDDLNFLFLDGILPSNKAVKDSLVVLARDNFNKALLSQQVNTSDSATIKKNLQKAMKTFLDSSANVYIEKDKAKGIESGEEKIYKDIKSFIHKIPEDFDYSDSKQIQSLKNDFAKMIKESYDQNSQVKPPINFKRNKYVSELISAASKRVENFAGLNENQKLISEDKFNNLPDDHELKIMLNNMSFMSGKVSERAAYYLYTMYSDPNAYKKAMEMNRDYRENQMLEMLNKTPYSASKPYVVNTYDDFKKIPHYMFLIKWLDSKFDPSSNEELVRIYNKLTTQDEKTVMKLIKETSDKDLGISYKNPYELLKRAKFDDSESSKLHSAVTNYTYSKSVLTDDDRKKNLEVLDKFNKWLNSKSGQKQSIEKQNIDFNVRVLDKSDNSLEGVYNTVHVDFQNMLIENDLKQYRAQLQKKYNVFLSSPNLSIYSNDQIDKSIVQDLLSVLTLIQAIKFGKEEIKKGDDSVETLEKLEQYKKNYSELAKKFIMINVQPRYQAKAADLFKKEMSKIIHTPASEQYKVDDQFIEFIKEKHITKDIPALLEHMIKVVPNMDLLDSKVDSEVFAIWRTLLNVAYKPSILNSIELTLKNYEDTDAGMNIAQLANAYRTVQTKMLKPGISFQNYITGYLSESFFDLENNDHTLKLFYSKLGLINESIDYVINRKRFDTANKSILSKINSFNFDDNSKDNIKLARKIYTQIKVEENRLSLLEILMNEPNNSAEKKKEIKSFISYANSKSKLIAKQASRIIKFVESNSKNKDLSEE